MVFPGKKKIYIFFFVFLLIIAGFYIFRRAEQEINLYSQAEFFMDTVVSIKIGEDPAVEKAVNKAFEVMKKEAIRLNRYKEDSVIYKINYSDGKTINIERDIFLLLKKAKKYQELSGGAFDISIAPLVDLWGFGKEKQRVPEDYEIKEILPLIDSNKLLLQKEYEQYRVYLPSEMSLDLGAIAKGYIIDKGVESLIKSGYDSFYINAGGNIRVNGEKSPGRSWHIGIRDPATPASILTEYITALKKGSLATSGDYERFFESEGKRYSHLLNPRTGYQERSLRSATIYAPTALQADILSTAVFIKGWEEGKIFINSLENVEGVLITDDEIWLSEGFKKLLILQ